MPGLSQWLLTHISFYYIYMYDTSYIDTLCQMYLLMLWKKSIFIITEKTRRKSGNTFLVYLKRLASTDSILCTLTQTVFVVCNVKEFESRGIELSFTEDLTNNESKWLWSRIETRDNYIYIYIFKNDLLNWEEILFRQKLFKPQKNALVLIIIIHSSVCICL